MNQYLLDYIAKLSCKQDADGKFVWKEDPMRMQKTKFSGDQEDPKPGASTVFVPLPAFRKAMSERLRGLKCRLAIFYGRQSEFFKDPASLRYMRAELDEHKP